MRGLLRLRVLLGDARSLSPERAEHINHSQICQIFCTRCDETICICVGPRIKQWMRTFNDSRLRLQPNRWKNHWSINKRDLRAVICSQTWITNLTAVWQRWESSTQIVRNKHEFVALSFYFNQAKANIQIKGSTIDARRRYKAIGFLASNWRAHARVHGGHSQRLFVCGVSWRCRWR